MTTHVFRSLNVFVPVGNQTSAESILAGVVSAANHDEITATVIVSVFEYRNLMRVKNIPMFKNVGSVIITNPDVFSCGKWYSPSEYIEMLKEEFMVWEMTIFDVNQFGLEFEQIRSKKGSVNVHPQIVCSPDGDEIKFINESIVPAAKSSSVVIDVPINHVKFVGSKLVIVGKDVAKPPATTDPANTADDTNVDAKILLGSTQTPPVDSSPAPTSPGTVEPVRPTCGVQGCTQCSKV